MPTHQLRPPLNSPPVLPRSHDRLGPVDDAARPSTWFHLRDSEYLSAPLARVAVNNAGAHDAHDAETHYRYYRGANLTAKAASGVYGRVP